MRQWWCFMQLLHVSDQTLWVKKKRDLLWRGDFILQWQPWSSSSLSSLTVHLYLSLLFFFNTPTPLLAPMLHIFSTPLTLSFSYSFLFLLLFFWVSSIKFFPNSPSATFIYAFAFYIIILCYFLIMFFMFCFILGSEMQRFIRVWVCLISLRINHKWDKGSSSINSV
jgi:hypothetical protein